MTQQEPVQQHYGVDDLTQQVNRYLESLGMEAGPIDWSALASLDQFHVRGLSATKELATCLELHEGATVLDVGCGLGGPARFLAAKHNCSVTGIDLSQPFIDVAQMLARRTGQEDRTTFVQGDALDLPFPDESFDHAWTQHVAMNIADRAGFYGSIRRVLKPGGKLAIYDVVAGDGQPLIFPLPWARQPEISSLLTSEEMRDALNVAGFEETSWKDSTDEGLAWFDELLARQSEARPAGLVVVMGSDFPEMAANMARNLKEGRARLVQAVVRRE